MLILVEDWHPRKVPVALDAPDAGCAAIERDGVAVGSTSTQTCTASKRNT